MVVKNEEICLMEECLTMKKWKEWSDVIRKNFDWMIDEDKRRADWEKVIDEKTDGLNVNEWRVWRYFVSRNIDSMRDDLTEMKVSVEKMMEKSDIVNRNFDRMSDEIERMKEKIQLTDEKNMDLLVLIFDLFTEISETIHFNPSDEWMRKWKEWDKLFEETVGRSQSLLNSIHQMSVQRSG
jgi:arginyl-tRNA synthetase